MTTPHDPKQHDDPSPLERLEAVIKADVAEARAIEPLVESAKVVTSTFRAKLKRALPLLALVALGAALVFGGLYDTLNLDNLAAQSQQLKAWVDLHPIVSALVLLVSIIVIIGTGLPGGTVLVVTGGFLFGIVQASIIAAVGDTIGACILYFAARRLFEAGASNPPPLVGRIRGGFQNNPVSFAFFIRLVPVFPFGVASVALAWLGCSLRLFVAASLFGVLPSTVIYASIGAGLEQALASRKPINLSLLAEPHFLIPLLALGVLALLPVAFGLRRRKPAGG
jgi:uncharacterized membrane protein YdjX (TVP38/TMEM64 family)